MNLRKIKKSLKKNHGIIDFLRFKNYLLINKTILLTIDNKNKKIKFEYDFIYLLGNKRKKNRKDKIILNFDFNYKCNIFTTIIARVLQDKTTIHKRDFYYHILKNKGFRLPEVD